MHERRQGPFWARHRVASPDTRARDRHAAQGVACSFGDVLDLSSSGMRAVSRSKPPVRVGQAAPMTITFGRKALKVQGRVVRVTRSGKAYEIGVQFVGVTPAASAALDAVARYGFVPSGRVKADSGGDAGARSGAPRGARAEQASGARAAGQSGGSRRTADRVLGRIVADLPNYYERLGVPPDASGEQIQQAFRALARRLHPDVNREPDAAELFAAAHEAYEVLRNHDARRVYNEAMAIHLAA